MPRLLNLIWSGYHTDRWTPCALWFHRKHRTLVFWFLPWGDEYLPLGPGICLSSTTTESPKLLLSGLIHVSRSTELYRRLFTGQPE